MLTQEEVDMHTELYVYMIKAAMQEQLDATGNIDMNKMNKLWDDYILDHLQDYTPGQYEFIVKHMIDGLKAMKASL